MNLEQALTLTKLQKEVPAMLVSKTPAPKNAQQIARRVFELSAAVGEPYQHGTPELWAQRWLASQKFFLVDIDPRHVAVPYVNKLSGTKITAVMQASADSLPPIVVDMNKQGIGKSPSGYVPKVIVVDGKNRHRAQMLCGRDRVQAWVGELAMRELLTRASNRKEFVIDAAGVPAARLSKMETEAILAYGATVRQDTGDGGSRPTGNTHAPISPSGGGWGGRMNAKKVDAFGSGGFGGVPGGGPIRRTGEPFRTGGMPSSPPGRTGPSMPMERPRMYSGAGGGAGAAGGPGGGVSGMNPERMGRGLNSGADPSDRNFGSDPSDRKQMLDPSDKEQFSQGQPKDGDPHLQSPGSGTGQRVKPSTGASNSEMSRRGIKAGPTTVKKIVTHKKR